MSIERKILLYLSEIRNKKPLKYKGLRIGFFGLPDFKYYKYQSLANSCSKLKQKGFVKVVNDEYRITEKGENFLHKKEIEYLPTFRSIKKENDPKNLLIIYDIPQDRTKERNWFRRALRKFNFVMIQRSVWVGPGPLPEDFLRYVKAIKLGENFKTFKLEKGYKTEK